jgi:SAM-dependent methyltransferase
MVVFDRSMDSAGWDERYSTRDYIWNAGPNSFVADHLGDLEPGTAIDLAAGEGRNAVWLAERGWEVTAVDFSPVGMEKAERLADERGVSATFVIADALTWEPAEPVDLVVIAYLQLPEAQQVSVLERASRWLAPGGTLFVVAHDRSNVAHGYGGPPSVEVCYDLDRTTAALVGLDVAVAEVAERRVDADGDGDGHHVALDTLVIARRPES